MAEPIHAHFYGAPCPVGGFSWPKPEPSNRAVRRGTVTHRPRHLARIRRNGGAR